MQKSRGLSLIITMTAFLIVLLVLVEVGNVRSTQRERRVAFSSLPLEMGGGELNGPGPTPSPKPEPDSTPDPGNKDEGKEVIIREETVVKEIYFPYEGLSGGIAGAITDILKNMTDGTKSKFQGTLENFQDNLPSYEATFTEVMFSTWKITATIAGILTPLVLSMVVASALKTGTSSVLGYAAARENLLNWVISVAAAASSYFLLSKAIAFSKALEVAIADGVADAVGESIHWGYHLIERLLFINITPSPISWILGFFAILLIVALCGTIILSWFAIKVVVLLMTALAPIVLIMGVLTPFRWLQGLWLKVTTIALLLWPVNVLLIGISVLIITTRFFSENISLSNDLFCYFVAAGIVSILIGLNSMFGKLVYGAAIEVAGKLKDALSTAFTMGLNLAMIPLGAAGMSGKIAGSPGALGKTAGGAGFTSGGVSGIGPGNPATSPLLIRSRQQRNNAIASAIEASGLPGSKGLAAGMKIGNAAEAHEQLLQNINAGFKSQPDLAHDLDVTNATTSAKEAFLADYGHDPDLLAQKGIEPNNLPPLADAGAHLAQVELSAMKTHADPSHLLTQMGMRGNLFGAAQGYARQVLEKTAFRERAGWGVRSDKPHLDLGSSSPSASDWMTADSLVWKKNFSPDDIQAIDVPTFHNLVRAVHQLRTNDGLQSTAISQNVKNVTDLTGLRTWIDTVLHDGQS
jgi:hypothetical protein